MIELGKVIGYDEGDDGIIMDIPSVTLQAPDTQGLGLATTDCEGNLIYPGQFRVVGGSCWQ